jgi:uncharacterized protein (DUF934 family)
MEPGRRTLTVPAGGELINPRALGLIAVRFVPYRSGRGYAEATGLGDQRM